VPRCPGLLRTVISLAGKRSPEEDAAAGKDRSSAAGQRWPGWPQQPAAAADQRGRDGL
jgi:hypothetical protein